MVSQMLDTQMVDSQKRVLGAGNEVINAVYEMHLDSLRFLLLAMSKVQYRSKELSREAFAVEVSGTEWQEIFGRSGGSSYRQLAKAAERLQTTQSAVVKVPLKDGHVKMQWADVCEYQEGEGYVVFVFGETIRKHIGNLRGDYTKLDLMQIKNLKSVYSIRIYLLLAQWRKTGFRVESVDDLRLKLNLGDKHPSFSAFRRYVLEKAVTDINTHTDMDVTYTLKKKGARVVGIEFKFNPRLALAP